MKLEGEKKRRDGWRVGEEKERDEREEGREAEWTLRQKAGSFQRNDISE